MICHSRGGLLADGRIMGNDYPRRSLNETRVFGTAAIARRNHKVTSESNKVDAIAHWSAVDIKEDSCSNR